MAKAKQKAKEDSKTKTVENSSVNAFKNLGKTTKYNYDSPDSEILETFHSPFGDEKHNKHGVKGTLHIEAPEFTTVCPITGQPDFATIVIDYEPDQLCVESKSLKLYLGAYRQHPSFHEGVVNRIANDLIDVLSPLYIKVEGRFTPRGGIPFWPVAEYHAAKNGTGRNGTVEAGTVEAGTVKAGTSKAGASKGRASKSRASKNSVSKDKMSKKHAKA